MDVLPLYTPSHLSLEYCSAVSHVHDLGELPHSANDKTKSKDFRSSRCHKFDCLKVSNVHKNCCVLFIFGFSTGENIHSAYPFASFNSYRLN